ncbi:MAG: hypothetical protein GY772_00790, partial [bacterium]|nr:hypothetical protein [bacterium]
AGRIRIADPFAFIRGVRLAVPEDLSTVKAWYSERYHEMVSRPAVTDLARKWRRGEADKVGTFKIYPHDRPGTPGEVPRKSARQNRHLDTVQRDELYPAPADPVMHAFRGDSERPGFLAGCSYGQMQGLRPDSPRMPQLDGGRDIADDSNYAWAPLARRVDIDRIFRVILDSEWFTSVGPCGSLGQRWKINPWSHMSPCKIAVAIGNRIPRAEVGVTDEGGTGRKSSSGARLYVMTTPTAKGEVLLLVAALMLESDFDVGCFRATLPDSRVVEWGVGATNPYTELAIQRLHEEEDPGVRREVLERAHDLAHLSWPLNSNVMTTLAQETALWAADEVQRAWLGAVAFEQAEVSMGSAGVFAAAPAAQAATEAIGSVSVVEAHPPAPGWHDDMNFPELNRQPVPEDLASSPADWVSDAEMGAAMHVPPAASASGATPEPAAASSNAAASGSRATPEPAASNSNAAASSSAAVL